MQHLTPERLAQVIPVPAAARTRTSADAMPMRGDPSASRDFAVTVCPDCSSIANGNGAFGLYCTFCQKSVVHPPQRIGAVERFLVDMAVAA